MALKKQSSSKLVDRLLRLHILKIKIPADSAAAYKILQQCREHFADAEEIDETDGIRFDWPDGWIHLRLSETEPALRLYSEWPDVDTARRKTGDVKRMILRSLAR